MTFRPPQTQEELDNMIEQRLQRARVQWERESGIPTIEQERDEARQRATRAERDATDRLVRRDARDVLGGMNVRDPKRQQTIIRLSDFSGVQAGEDGEPNRKQVTDAIKAAHKELPDLFGPDATVMDAAPDAGETAAADAPGPLTRQQVDAMSPREINSSWDRVKSFLSGERS